MIIIKIVGGLASQLHKFAIGKALALRHNTELKLDISWYENIPTTDTVREYQLNKYDINASIATIEEINRFKPNRYFIKINNKISKYTKFKFSFSNYCNESFITLERFKLLPDDIYLEGEWSGYEYFDSIKNILISEIKLKEEYFSKSFFKYKNIINDNNCVSMHIRRGDYVNNKHATNFHIVCSVSYYENAIKYFEEKVDNFVLLIFSDDLSWVKDNIKIPEYIKVYYVENTNDYEEFDLLKSCKHNIISNSGFSWFSSWLNENPNKIVISPKTWIKSDELNEIFLKTMEDNHTICIENLK